MRSALSRAPGFDSSTNPALARVLKLTAPM